MKQNLAMNKIALLTKKKGFESTAQLIRNKTFVTFLEPFERTKLLTLSGTAKLGKKMLKMYKNLNQEFFLKKQK